MKSEWESNDPGGGMFLTETQKIILELRSEGKKNKEIAWRLRMSEKTIELYITNMMSQNSKFVPEGDRNLISIIIAAVRRRIINKD